MTTDKTVEAVEWLNRRIAHFHQTGAGQDDLITKVETLLSELTRLQEEVEGLARFAKVALDCLWDGYDLEGSDIQDAALQHGLIVQTAFDPNIHSDRHGVGVNPGDEWFVPAPWLATLQGQQS